MIKSRTMILFFNKQFRERRGSTPKSCCLLNRWRSEGASLDGKGKL